MWFIFPKIRGLDPSETARSYAISGRSEAIAYLDHSIFGPRFQERTYAMLKHLILAHMMFLDLLMTSSYIPA